MFSARYTWPVSQGGRGSNRVLDADAVASSQAWSEGPARMEKELDKNLGVVPRVERSHSCWETRKVYVKEEIL